MPLPGEYGFEIDADGNITLKNGSLSIEGGLTVRDRIQGESTTQVTNPDFVGNATADNLRVDGNLEAAGLSFSNVPVGEGIAAGNLVGIDPSTHLLVNAYGGSAGPVAAIGIVTATYQESEFATVYRFGTKTQAGLTLGDTIYLNITTAGGVQKEVPAGAGNLKQIVGVAVASNKVAVAIEPAATL